MSIELVVAEESELVRNIMRSEDVAALDVLASQASTVGAAMTAISYLAAYRIYELYRKVDNVPDKVLERHLTMQGFVLPETGSTGLRRYYCASFYGWSAFMSWVDDWVSMVPTSRSSVWTKMQDIIGWRNTGASWETILKLLSHTPMAGRDFLEKPVQPEALPPGGEQQYLEELAELPPGQARKKVSEDAGEVQIWIQDAQYHRGSLLLKVIQEWSGGRETYDLLCRQVSDHPTWLAVAYWMASKLGKKLMLGG